MADVEFLSPEKAREVARKVSDYRRMAMSTFADAETYRPSEDRLTPRQRHLLSKVSMESVMREAAQANARRWSIVHRHIVESHQLGREALNTRRLNLPAGIAGKALLRVRQVNKRRHNAGKVVVRGDGHALQQIGQSIDLRGLQREFTAQEPDFSKQLGVGVAAGTGHQSSSDLNFQNPTAAVEAAHRLSETSK